jgi:ribonuclease BN (tRNA processing enzyme)
LAITTLIFPATVGQYRNVKLTVVGCSPAWPNPGSAHSGYLVTSGEHRLLLDCGPGVLARLREQEPWPSIDAIVITHLHLDHCGDLVPWLWGHALGPAQGTPGPHLFVPPAGLVRISTFAPLGRFLEVFDVHEYEDGRPFDAGGHTVTARAVNHYGEPAFGLRVENDGSVLAYSGDSGPTPSLVELSRGADVLICEATLLEPEQGPHGHLSADEARAIAAEAGVERLLLTHRAAEHELDELVYDGFELEL